MASVPPLDCQLQCRSPVCPVSVVGSQCYLNSNDKKLTLEIGTHIAANLAYFLPKKLTACDKIMKVPEILDKFWLC